MFSSTPLFRPNLHFSNVKRAGKDSVADTLERSQLATELGPPFTGGRVHCVSPQKLPTLAACVGRFLMCYQKAPNLGNPVPYRNISKRMGAKVSAYLAQT